MAELFSRAPISSADVAREAFAEEDRAKRIETQVAIDGGDTSAEASAAILSAADVARSAFEDDGRARELETKTRLQQNGKIEAEKQAKALSHARLHSIPVDVARRNLDKLDEEKRLADLDKARADAPSYAKVLEDEGYGPIAQSAVSEMPYFERVVRSYGQAFSAGSLQDEASLINRRRMMGTATPQDIERLGQIKTELKGKQTDFDIGGVAGFFQYPVGSTPGMVSTLVDALPAAGAGAALYGGLALIGGQAGPQAATPEEIVTVPGAALLGGGRGLAVGYIAGSYDRLAGEAYGDTLDTLDENGNPLDHDTAYAVATFAGGVGTVAELLPLDAAFKNMPFLSGVVGKYGVKRLTSIAAKNPAARASLARMGRILQTGAAESVAELIQEASKLEAIIAAGGVTDEQGNALADQRMERYAEAAYGGFAGGTTLAAGGEAVTATEQSISNMRVKRAEAKQQALVDLGDRIRNSKVNQISPDTLIALSEQIDRDGGGAQMTVPAEKLVELFQSEGLTPEQVQQRFPELTEPMAEAAGGNAEVPLNTSLLFKLAQLEGFAGITDDVRTAPGEDTLNEARAAQQTEFDTFTASVSEQDQKAAVFASLEAEETKRLVSAGMEPRAAAVNARLHASVMTRLAEESGKTVDQLLAERNLSIVREGQGQQVPDATVLAQEFGVDPVQMAEEIRAAGGDVTQTPAFRNWFGDSKVVDESGAPLVVYHGTRGDVEAFDADRIGERFPFSDGFYFASAGRAEVYADSVNNDAVNWNPASRFAKPVADGANVMPVYLSLRNPLIVDSPDIVGETAVDGTDTVAKARAAGHDGVIVRANGKPDLYIAFDPTQIKSVNNRGTFDPQDPNILFQEGAPRVEGQSEQPGNKHGLMPHLRVETGIDIPAKKKPLFAQTTMNSTAPRQIAAIDDVLARHPNATASVENWNAMMSDALASNDVPLPPYNFIKNLNSDGARNLLSRLSKGQIADADHGFKNAAQFRKLYTEGKISIEDTGRLFLWSFLSRGVSPYTQESLFIDSFDGIDQWIEAAANGTLKDRLGEYEAWAKSAAPKGSGQPGAGATHNLNAFGNLFLLKMSEDAGDGSGRSRLQVLHDMMSDPNATGRQVRRKFLEMGEGVGIDNKVVSFTLLVAGFTDVMVLDRVQIRELWNDGRFDNINLYDGYKVDGAPVAGSALSNLTYGARGLLIYEAIEQGLKAKINDLYAALGRPDAASVGRYHWETWVASSNQEASHATIDAILARAKGVNAPLAGVTAKEGEYGAFAYGARYGRDWDGSPYFLYSVPGVGDFKFTVDGFRGFLEQIKVGKNKIIPSKFKVTESGNGPWYNRKEVNLEKLGELAARLGQRYEADTLSADDAANGIDPPVSNRLAADQPGAPQEGITEGPSPGPSSSGGTTLLQTSSTTRTTARGFIEISPAKDKFTITLTGKADLSTFQHEAAHYYLEVIQALVASGDASAALVADLQKIRDWMGLKEGEAIERRHHEMFARGWEAYLMEGRAPSADLQSAFNRFRAWLTFVYKRLVALDVELTDEVRGVMDRLVASEAQIAEARTNIGWAKPLPKEALFLSDDEYDRYVEAWNKASEAQQREVDAKLMLEAARETQAAWKEERQKVLEEEREKLAQTRGYRAWKLLSEGQGLEDAAPGRTSLKIDPETVPPEWRRDVTGMTDEMGLPLEAVAEILGFDSGEQMISLIAGAKFAERDLPARVKKIMAERHGDMDATALADAAMAAVHSDDTQEVLLTEFRAMAAKAGIGAPPPGLAKWMAAQAQAKVLGLTRRQLDPMRWRRAELKAATDAAKAAAKGDATKAAIHKRQQMMAAAMYRATVQADKRVDVIRRKLLPFTKNDRRAKLGKAGDTYLDGIDEILEAIQLKPMSAKAADKISRLEKLVAAANEAGEPLVLPDKLRAMLGKKNFQDMTLEELEGVHDAVMNIWHLAKLKNELKARNEKRELTQVLEEAAANAEASLGSKPLQKKFQEDWRENSGSRVNKWRASLSKMEFILTWLDNQPGGLGLLHKLIFQPLADANKRKFDLMRHYHETIIQYMHKMPAEQKARWASKRNFLGATDATGATIIMAALNLGNEGNKSRLFKGYGLDTPQQQQALLAEIDAFLTKEDVDFIRHVWKELDLLWPEVVRVTKVATGLEPEKVTPTPFVTKFGTFEGGYFPVVYNLKPNAWTDMSVTEAMKTKKDNNDPFTNAYLNPALSDGFTKGRIDMARNPPLLLDLQVISTHLAEVTHYVTHYEAVMQAHKIIKDPRFAKIVTETMGVEFYRPMKQWLIDIATDQDAPPITREEPVAEAMQWLRGGVTIANMGFNFFTGWKQLLGVIPAIDEVGIKYMALGMAKAWASPSVVQNWKDAFKKSGVLWPLLREFDRDVRKINDIYMKSPTLNRMQQIRAGGFAHIGFMQAVVNVATWQAAYDKALDRKMTEQEAIDYADATVRMTQGSGNPMDLAPVQRSSEINKMLTIHYSWLSVLFNRLDNINRRTRRIRDVPKAMQRVFIMLTGTVVVEEVFRQAWEQVVDNVDDEDDDEWVKGFILTSLFKTADTAISTIPLLRSVASTEYLFGDGFKPELTPVGRIFTDLERSTIALRDIVMEGELPSRSEGKALARTASVITQTPFAGVYNLIDEFLGEDIFGERRKQ